MHNWNRLLNSWQNPHIGVLICRVMVIVVQKANWKLLELPLSREIVNQKEYRVLGKITEISATIKGLKDAGVVILTTSPFNSLI